MYALSMILLTISVVVALVYGVKVFNQLIYKVFNLTDEMILFLSFISILALILVGDSMF